VFVVTQTALQMPEYSSWLQVDQSALAPAGQQTDVDDTGALGLSDFLFVVILGDAAQNGMIGSATSATDGMVLIGTFVFWSYMPDFMSFRFPVVQRFTAVIQLAYPLTHQPTHPFTPFRPLPNKEFPCPA